jgi:integrase
MNVSDLRIHDLRRTLGSYMAIGGESLPVIGEALGHKDHRTTTIYARLSRDPVLQAVEKAVRLMRA